MKKGDLKPVLESLLEDESIRQKILGVIGCELLKQQPRKENERCFSPPKKPTFRSLRGGRITKTFRG
jgi:hypothetical protein